MSGAHTTPVLAVTVLLFALAGCSGGDEGRATETTQFPSTSTTSTTMVLPSTTTRVASTPAPTTTPATAAEATQPIATTALGRCPSIEPGVHEVALTAGGAEHPVRVFVPTAYGSAPLPLVIDWHGLGSNGTEQAMFSGYESLAEAEGFLVVHPTGVSDVPSGPNSWQLFAATGARDDLAFAEALIDDLIDHWCAERSRVYSTGMSNGGFFTARLVCELSDRIAAAVSVAGLFHPDDCTPQRPVPFMAIHGTDDRVVPFDGSGESVLLSPDAPDSYRVFFEQVIPREFGEFAADAQCAPAGTTTIGSDVVEHVYADCSGGVAMTFFEVEGGGHTWPGSPMADLVRGSLGHTTESIDATADGWAFMRGNRLR